MGADEVGLGVALVAALVAVSAYYAWRQLQWLRQPRGEGEAETPEGLYRRAQARRRLVGSGLMLLLAAQLAGALLFLQEPARRQAARADARAAEREAGRAPPQPSAEERSFAGLYGAYVVVFLLTLLAMVLLALADYVATHRFAVQAHRQLREERRDMIDREVARLRQERQQRNGHG